MAFKLIGLWRHEPLIVGVLAAKSAILAVYDLYLYDKIWNFASIIGKLLKDPTLRMGADDYIEMSSPALSRMLFIPIIALLDTPFFYSLSLLLTSSCPPPCQQVFVSRLTEVYYLY